MTQPPQTPEERLVWWYEFRRVQLTGSDAVVSPYEYADAVLTYYRSKFPSAPPDTKAADRLSRIAAEVQDWENDENRNSTRTLDRIVKILREKP